MAYNANLTRCRTGWSELRQADLADAADADCASRSLGEVNDASVSIGPTIIDSDHDSTSCLLVRHTNARPKRKSLVGGRHGVGIEPLPTCRFATVEPWPVPRRSTLLSSLGGGHLRHREGATNERDNQNTPCSTCDHLRTVVLFLVSAD